MKNSQKLAIRSSEIRTRLNEIAGMETDAVTDEIRNEADQLRGELGTVETQYRAALAGEAEAEERAAAGFADDDPETRERRELRKKSKVGNYIVAAIEQRAAVGAEAEFNASLGIGANRFPLEMLAPLEPEKRATSDTDTATMPRTWLDRLFVDSTAAYLGITMESVPSGQASFPVTTAGADGAQRSREQVTADAAWTVGVTELKPKRHAARLIFTVEDAARIPGLEMALTRDLGMAVRESIDEAILKGEDVSGSDADIVGIETAASVTETEITQAQKITGPGVIDAFSDQVDGRHAYDFGDLNVVLGVGAWRLWADTIINSAADNMTTRQFLRDAGLMYRMRDDIASGTVANAFAGFLSKSRGLSGAGVAAMWDAADLIRDPYSSAAKGEVALTLNVLWDFGIVRATNFGRVKFVA